jgi:DNA-binding Lrp family transcriptional regulator
MVIRRTPVGSSSATIKARNISAVLLTLLRHQPISRVQLAERTGLSTTTITNLIADLIEQRIVTQIETQPEPARRRSVGRPQQGCVWRGRPLRDRHPHRRWQRQRGPVQLAGPAGTACRSTIPWTAPRAT